jgi:hypothetical protein
MRLFQKKYDECLHSGIILLEKTCGACATVEKSKIFQLAICNLNKKAAKIFDFSTGYL